MQIVVVAVSLHSTRATRRSFPLSAVKIQAVMKIQFPRISLNFLSQSRDLPKILALDGVITNVIRISTRPGDFLFASCVNALCFELIFWKDVKGGELKLHQPWVWIKSFCEFNVYNNIVSTAVSKCCFNFFLLQFKFEGSLSKRPSPSNK